MKMQTIPITKGFKHDECIGEARIDTGHFMEGMIFSPSYIKKNGKVELIEISLIRIEKYEELRTLVKNMVCEVWDENKPQTKTQQLSISEPEKQAILMQYTELKDKNGKEIYEGDILESVDLIEKYEVKNIHEVNYDNHEMIIDVEDCEIIGNIYENPNLLE